MKNEKITKKINNQNITEQQQKGYEKSQDKPANQGHETEQQQNPTCHIHTHRGKNVRKQRTSKASLDYIKVAQTVAQIKNINKTKISEKNKKQEQTRVWSGPEDQDLERGEMTYRMETKAKEVVRIYT